MAKNDDKIGIEIVSSTKKTTTTTDPKQVKRDIKNFHDNVNKVDRKAAEKINKIRAERQEASRLASLANKRLRRLEQKGLIDSPAYKATNGYFSVRGKSQAEVQSMLRELDKFINAKTSTVRGVNNYVREIASNTGVKYKNLKDLQSKIPKFFELSSKVEQYLRNIEDMASAIDYNQIWQQINVYVADNKIDLSQAGGDIDGMIKHVSNALKKFEETTTVAGTTFRLRK